MKTSIIVLGALLATAAAQTQEVKIISYTNDVRPDGYDFAYELSDGTLRQERGTLKNPGTDNEIWAVTGFTKWISPDGKERTQEYGTDDAIGALPPSNIRAALAGKK